MNELFRNIKSRNLDLLEESDDEDEFENISETKYVDMNKSVIMNCEFNSKFKDGNLLRSLKNIQN